METVQAVQTKDYIIQAIRDEILSGRMKPGEELAQENVAQMLGVSRMPSGVAWKPGEMGTAGALRRWRLGFTGLRFPFCGMCMSASCFQNCWTDIFLMRF